ncbi:glycosyltransferase [Naumannella huperziae]
MYSFLMAGPPFYGHVNPVLTVVKELVESGHAVRYMTGSRFAAAVTEAGATYVPLPGDADFDDRTLAEEGPRLSGLKEIREDVIRACIDPARSQYDALRAELATRPADVVMADPTFFGAALLAAHPAHERPLVIGGGILPLMLSSRYAPPFGLGISPSSGRWNVARNVALNTLVQKVGLRRVQRAYGDVYAAVHGRRPAGFAFDWYATTDAVVQFTIPSFEYSRPDAGVDIHFAGPANRVSQAPSELPPWWGDLQGGQPVVVATQGTYRNVDLSEVIHPTIEGLADEDVLVVITTGGRPIANVGPLPTNVRAAEFIPYHELLPLTDAYVTNGGYGGIHFAMQYGVPIVTAGDTEDKPESCARVAWTGVGINLRTGKPSAETMRRSVQRVLTEPQFREASQRLSREINDSAGTDVLVEVVGELLSNRAAQAARR